MMTKQHKQKHPFKYMVVDGEKVKIDKGLYTLIEELNKHGLKTTSCCEESPDGTKYIGFSLEKNVHISITPLGKNQKTDLILVWSKPGINVRDLAGH